MIEVVDFSRYTEEELRKLLIENAKPIAGGMDRVVREITKKYKACDREMLLWFINAPPYNGKLWAPDVKRIISAEDAAKEERRLAYEMEKAQKQKINRPKVVKHHAPIPQVYVKPARPKVEKKRSIVDRFKALGCKPVLIADKVVGIKKLGAYARIAAVKAEYPDWQVVEYGG
jgi:hypothetical protein